MTILEEAMEKPKVEDFSTESEQTENSQEQKGFSFSSIMDILKIPTGPGSLDEYKESPLNFDHSEGMSRILRGSAGFMGADVLRSAVIDIVFGFLQWGRERVKANAQS